MVVFWTCFVISFISLQVNEEELQRKYQRVISAWQSYTSQNSLGLSDFVTDSKSPFVFIIMLLKLTDGRSRRTLSMSFTCLHKPMAKNPSTSCTSHCKEIREPAVYVSFSLTKSSSILLVYEVGYEVFMTAAAKFHFISHSKCMFYLNF